MPIAFNEINEKANGGTEAMARKLNSLFTKEELDHVQIIPSRVRSLDDNKVRIFWCHDLPEDGESTRVLENDGWKNFERIVFVSHWQKERYIQYYRIPYERCIVLQNAIDPITDIVKPDPKEKIKIIYHTTPHRGLHLAYTAIDKVVEKYPQIEFNVFSSFKIYGWEERDKHYENLFKAIDSHPNMVYHGTVSNDDVRRELSQSHIFAYPSIWPETSCISLIEAMSAKCLCIHPDLAALPETAANWTYMYNFSENEKNHCALFASCVENGCNSLLSDADSLNLRLSGQKSYADLYYSWDMRKIQWGQLLEALKEADVYPVIKNKINQNEFVYRTA